MICMCMYVYIKYCINSDISMLNFLNFINVLWFYKGVFFLILGNSYKSMLG